MSTSNAGSQRIAALAIIIGLLGAVVALAQTPTRGLAGYFDTEASGNTLVVSFTEWWSTMQLDSGGGYFTGWDYNATPTPPASSTHIGSNTLSATADFEDAASESFQRHFKLPADWTGTVDIALFWYSTATTGTVVWQIQTACVADGESDDPAWNTAQTILDTTKGTASRMNAASLTSVTMTGCAAGELLHLKVLRDAAHASDTLAASASLVGIEFKYRRSI